MTKVTFISHEGIEHAIEAQNGRSLMEAAMQNNVRGIDADCGGTCSCATCHVYVAEDWAERLPPAEGMEEIMLDFAENVEPTSRLSCQIQVTQAMEGLVVRVPASQH